MTARCPICGKLVLKADLRAAGGRRSYFPFCSRRCQLVDLNAWFESEYVISSPMPDEDKKVSSKNSAE